MNYILKIDRKFTKLESKQNDINKIFATDLHKMENDITETINGNEELVNFIYPILTEYTDKDILEVINKHFNINCDTINKFDKNIKLTNDIIIKVINNINNYIVINSICNLNNIYKEVYICNTFYDNPQNNIHYVVCKDNNKDINNKDTNNYNSFEVISDNICMNDNLENIYDYLYSYYSSIQYLISIFNKKDIDSKAYNIYCSHYK